MFAAWEGGAWRRPGRSHRTDTPRLLLAVSSTLVAESSLSSRPSGTHTSQAGPRQKKNDCRSPSRLPATPTCGSTRHHANPGPSWWRDLVIGTVSQPLILAKRCRTRGRPVFTGLSDNCGQERRRAGSLAQAKPVATLAAGGWRRTGPPHSRYQNRHHDEDRRPH